MEMANVAAGSEPAEGIPGCSTEAGMAGILTLALALIIFRLKRYH
jgi:hypothetical protein